MIGGLGGMIVEDKEYIKCCICWKKDAFGCDAEIPDCPFFETVMECEFDRDERMDW